MGKILSTFLKGLAFGIFLAILLVFSPFNNQSGKVEGITISAPAPISTPTPAVKYIPTSTPTQTPVPTKPIENSNGGLLGLVNNYRQQKGLPQLSETDSLCQYAQIRTEQIQFDFSHTQFQNDISSGVMFQTYCQGCKSVAENIAGEYKSEEDALNSWINSPGHRANLEGDYNVGCGSSSGNFYVFVFKKR